MHHSVCKMTFELSSTKLLCTWNSWRLYVTSVASCRYFSYVRSVKYGQRCSSKLFSECTCTEHLPLFGKSIAIVDIVDMWLTVYMWNNGVYPRKLFQMYLLGKRNYCKFSQKNLHECLLLLAFLLPGSCFSILWVLDIVISNGRRTINNSTKFIFRDTWNNFCCWDN